MDVQMLTQYFLRYVAVFIFVIILLEYMNLPGFPAGIIMPLAGIWAARGQISFFMVMALAWRPDFWEAGFYMESDGWEGLISGPLSETFSQT